MMKHVPVPIRNCAAMHNQKLSGVRNFSPKPSRHSNSPIRFIWTSEQCFENRLKNTIITMMPARLAVDVQTTCSVGTPQILFRDVSTGV